MEITSRIEIFVERKAIVLLLKEDKRWMFEKVFDENYHTGLTTLQISNLLRCLLQGGEVVRTEF
jgi:hypothetical protein